MRTQVYTPKINKPSANISQTLVTVTSSQLPTSPKPAAKSAAKPVAKLTANLPTKSLANIVIPGQEPMSASAPAPAPAPTSPAPLSETTVVQKRSKVAPLMSVTLPPAPAPAPAPARQVRPTSPLRGAPAPATTAVAIRAPAPATTVPTPEAGSRMVQLSTVQNASQMQTLLNSVEYDEWQNELQRFLYNRILPMTEPDAEKRLVLVNNVAMEYWKIAFTTRYYNPNLGENYEILEKIGDASMKSAFIFYILKRVPTLDQSQLTLLVAHYLKTEEQALISRRLGLGDWILSLIPINIKVLEDVLEALFGALQTIGDQEVRSGEGSRLTLNLISSIFQDIRIDPKIFAGPPKTQIKEMFEGMGWTQENVSEIEIWQSTPGSSGGTLTLILPKAAIMDLTAMQMGPIAPILAVAEGTTKTVAEKIAYPRALETLERMGVTYTWAQQIRFQNDFEHPDLAPYYPTALARARREGYESIAYSKPKKGSQGCYVQLIGIRSDKRQEILQTIINCTTPDGRREALRRYATNS